MTTQRPAPTSVSEAVDILVRELGRDEAEAHLIRRFRDVYGTDREKVLAALADLRRRGDEQ